MSPCRKIHETLLSLPYFHGSVDPTPVKDKPTKTPDHFQISMQRNQILKKQLNQNLKSNPMILFPRQLLAIKGENHH